jgi:hypothetical protein
MSGFCRGTAVANGRCGGLPGVQICVFVILETSLTRAVQKLYRAPLEVRSSFVGRQTTASVSSFWTAPGTVSCLGLMRARGVHEVRSSNLPSRSSVRLDPDGRLMRFPAQASNRHHRACIGNRRLSFGSRSVSRDVLLPLDTRLADGRPPLIHPKSHREVIVLQRSGSRSRDRSPVMY